MRRTTPDPERIKAAQEHARQRRIDAGLDPGDDIGRAYREARAKLKTKSKRARG